MPVNRDADKLAWGSRTRDRGEREWVVTVGDPKSLRFFGSCNARPALGPPVCPSDDAVPILPARPSTIPAFCKDHG
jgi:hypothetical protein